MTFITFRPSTYLTISDFIQTRVFPLLCKIWDGFPDHLGGLENSKIYDRLGFPTNKIRLNFNSSHRRKFEKVPFVNTVKLRLTATSVIRSPCHLPLGKTTMHFLPTFLGKTSC